VQASRRIRRLIKETCQLLPYIWSHDSTWASDTVSLCCPQMATTADPPGTLRTGEAVPVAEPKRGGMFGGGGGREGAGTRGDGMFSVNPKARMGLVITQILTAIVSRPALRSLCISMCAAVASCCAISGPLCLLRVNISDRYLQ